MSTRRRSRGRQVLPRDRAPHDERHPAPAEGERPLLGAQGEHPLAPLATHRPQRADAGLRLGREEDGEAARAEPLGLRLGRAALENTVQVEPAALDEEPGLVRRQVESARQRLRGQAREIECHHQPPVLSGARGGLALPGRARRGRGGGRERRAHALGRQRGAAVEARRARERHRAAARGAARHGRGLRRCAGTRSRRRPSPRSRGPRAAGCRAHGRRRSLRRRPAPRRGPPGRG